MQELGAVSLEQRASGDSNLCRRDYSPETVIRANAVFPLESLVSYDAPLFLFGASEISTEWNRTHLEQLYDQINKSSAASNMKWSLSNGIHGVDICSFVYKPTDQSKVLLFENCTFNNQPSVSRR